MGEYISRTYVGNGWVVNFADASAKGGGDAPLIYRYGRAVGSEEMMQFAAYLLMASVLLCLWAMILSAPCSPYYGMENWKRRPLPIPYLLVPGILKRSSAI